MKALCALSDIRGGHVVSDDGEWIVIADGEQVCVARNRCPHQSLSLEGGSVADGQLQCPHHGVRFSLEDGSITDDRGYWDLDSLQIVPNTVENGNVLIEEGGK